MNKDAPQPLPPQYHPVSYYQTIPLPVNTVHAARSGSPLRRFLIAFLAAVGVYAILRTISFHYVPGIPGGRRWDVPSDLTLNHCISSDAWAVADVSRAPRWTGTPFEIPLQRDTVLHFGSYRGAFRFPLSGSLEVTTSSSLNSSATVSIMSVSGTRDSDVRACKVTGHAGEVGVGIFTRGWRWSPTQLKIRLVLPETAAPLQLKGLDVNLPNFSLNIGDLKDAVGFDSVSLITANSPVHVESLSATVATLHTSNAPIGARSLISPKLSLKTTNGRITGMYNTSSSLWLETSNAPINVDVGLTASTDSVQRATELIMRTSNNILDARVGLYAAPDVGCTTTDGGSAFQTKATTSNGRLLLAFPAFARGSALQLDARTSNAPTEVTLHPAYNGRFEAHTSAEKAIVVDRSGDGEDGRRIEFKGHSRGYVYDEGHAENKDRGRVEVRTSNSPVKLLV